MLLADSHNEVLQQHMYNLYQAGEMCDLELFSVDGVTFRVHRLVLTASSKYLYNLCLQTTELTSFPLDIKSDVLHVLLEFCYTGKLFLTTDRCIDIQNAAVLLQMCNILELLNKQKDATSQMNQDVGVRPSQINQNLGTSHINHYQNVGTSQMNQNIGVDTSHMNQVVGTSQMNKALGECNQSVLPCKSSQTEEYGLENDENDPTTTLFKYEGQREIHNNEILEGRQTEENMIIKQEEVPVFYDEDAKEESKSHYKAVNVKVNVNKNTPCTRSKSKLNKNDIKHTKDFTQGNDLDRRKKSTAFTGIKGRRTSSKVNDNDPDYEPEMKKVKVNKSRESKTRSTKHCDEPVTIKTLRSGEHIEKIFIRIKDPKIVKTVGCHRNRKRGYKKFSKIFVPESFRKTCPDCNKTFVSSASLHRHQLCVHFTKNCTLLRHILIVKLSQRNSDISNCVIDKTFPPHPMKFKCKLCHRKFSKYCQFTLHHRKKHKTHTRPLESWLRYCSVKLAMQKLLVPFAKDRKCNSSFVNKEKRSRRENKERTFKCDYCNKMLLTQYTLETHKRNMHGDTGGREIIHRERIPPPEPLFVCTDCNKSKGSLRTLNNHLQLQHKYTTSEANRLQFWLPASLPCEHCEFKTRDLQEMKAHVTAEHPFVKYQCTECSLSFKVLLLMKRHKYACHVVGKYNFRCQQCEKSFKKGSMLRKHEYFKHGIEHKDVKIFYCEHPGCTYKTYTSTAIKLHQNKHMTEKLFPCEYCGLKLKSKLIHEKHVAKMHLGIRPFLCQVCGLSFGEKHELQSHITNRHSNERNYQCQFCPYRTAVKATFFTHVFNVHKVRAEEDKRELFSCPHCPFTSILKYRYQTHVNGHTNTRNYECKLCSKSFVSANTLRSHKQWVHSDKVYSCTQCDYQTKTSQKLNEHIRVQHQLQGFKPYKCPYCQFRCATGGNTRKHVKQVHKGQEVTYIRDDELLAAARMARASGHYASLLNSLSSVHLTREVSEDERSELSDNILHIAL